MVASQNHFFKPLIERFIILVKKSTVIQASISKIRCLFFIKIMEYIQYEFSDTNKIHSIEKNSDSNRKKYQNMELPLQMGQYQTSIFTGIQIFDILSETCRPFFYWPFCISSVNRLHQLFSFFSLFRLQKK